jgi:hypothetical protein
VRDQVPWVDKWPQLVAEGAVLYYEDGLSQEEIAGTLTISHCNVSPPNGSWGQERGADSYQLALAAVRHSTDTMHGTVDLSVARILNNGRANDQ